MRQLTMLSCALSLAACGDGEATRQSVKDDQLIFYAEEQVRQRLRDPGSAEFTGIRVSHKAGVPAICGRVNSHNAFGGMAGPERFISGGATALESDMAPGEFDVSWGQLC